MDFGALPERFGLLVFCGLVGIVAGGVRAAIGKEPQPNPLRNVLANAAGSGFTSFLVAAVMMDQWKSGRDYAVIAIAGVAGWAGASILDLATQGATSWVGKMILRFTSTAPAPTDEGKKP